MNLTRTTKRQTQAPQKGKAAQRNTVEVITLPERFDAFAPLDLPSGPVADGTSIVIDARSVRFADLHALQSLVDARLRVLDAGGELHIGAPSLELRVTLELTGFDALLSVLAGEER